MLSHLKLIFATSGAKVYGLIAGLVSLWLTFHILGPELRGILIVCLTWMRTASGIAHLSLGQAILNYAGKIKDNSWLPHTLGTAISVCLLMTSILWVLLVSIKLLMPTIIGSEIPDLLFFAMLFLIPFFIWDFYNQSLLTGVGRIPAFNKALIASQTVMIVLLPLMYILQLFGAYIALLAGRITNLIISTRALKKELKGQVIFTKGHTKSLLKKSLILHPAIVSAILVANADILMINYFIDATQSGFYQMASQLLMAMLVLPQTAMMIMFSLISKKGLSASWQECRNISLIICGIMLLSSVAAVFLSPVIIPLVLGKEATPVVPLFQLLQITILGQTLASLASPQWIMRGYFFMASAISIFNLGINILLNWILIPTYGVLGAIISTSFVFIVSIFINGGLMVKLELDHRKTNK